MHPDIIAAKRLLKNEADEAVISAVAKRDARGSGEWVLDPEHDGVVGFLDADTGSALVVVYLPDEDFEISEDLEEEIFCDD